MTQLTMTGILPVLKHQELCERACSWLSGSGRCGVVLSGIASTKEIPDAIGWSTSWCNFGSTVVECKVSLSDFLRDGKKRHEKRLGNRRYFMVPAGLISAEQIEKRYPDHGLLWVRACKVSVERAAVEREQVNLRAENRLLHFALVHMRSNLLRMGFSVNLNLLALHPVTVRKKLDWPSTDGLRKNLLPLDFVSEAT